MTLPKPDGFGRRCNCLLASVLSLKISEELQWSEHPYAHVVIGNGCFVAGTAVGADASNEMTLPDGVNVIKYTQGTPGQPGYATCSFNVEVECTEFLPRLSFL